MRLLQTDIYSHNLIRTLETHKLRLDPVQIKVLPDQDLLCLEHQTSEGCAQFEILLHILETFLRVNPCYRVICSHDYNSALEIERSIV